MIMHYMGRLKMLIKFYTKGCQPCYALSVALDKLMIEYTEVDIGKDLESAIKHEVMSVPTLLNTETGNRLTGFTSQVQLEEWLHDNQH